MSFLNIPDIIANQPTYLCWVGIDPWSGDWLYEPFNVGYNMTPLPKTWYEEEVDTETTKTIRFAKRSDHTGILIKIDKAGFYTGFDKRP